jgi:hypothetical protein
MANLDDYDLSPDAPSKSTGDSGSTDEMGQLKGPSGLVRIPLALLLIAALWGAWFAATSTSDFVQHLDREVHKIHCSYNPSADIESTIESPCRTVMLSPYSSWFRQDYWGGIPVSLWAIAVFAFLAYRAGHLLIRGRSLRSEGFFLMMATLLPAIMSALYYWLAVTKVGAICKVCQGIYWSSAAAAVFGLVTLVMSKGSDGKGIVRFFVGVVEGTAFVVILTGVYLAMAPKADPTAGGPKGCGTLAQPADENGIMLALAPHPGGTPTIEVLDPLCPSCKAFDTRLTASEMGSKLDMKGVLFPLDSTCNWMVSQSMHPGACAISEAMLCAAGNVTGQGNPAEARKILDWAFAHQEELITQAKTDEPGLRKRLESEFPTVKGCLGGNQVKNKLTKSLRWIVANALNVLTPQVFINGTRMCDEDTDLGLEYTLSHMLAGAAGAKK